MKINPLSFLFRNGRQQFRIRLSAVTLICLALQVSYSCTEKNRQHPEPVEHIWNFTSGNEGWNGDFSEYPFGEEALYELLFEYDSLPMPLDHEQGALKLSGNNLNGDLFMFVKKKITGLDPNTVYYVSFNVEFASNVPADSTDQESPGQLVFMGAGATPVEPMKVNGESNIYHMNIDKYNLNRDGEDMIVMGNVSNGLQQADYSLVSLENENPFRVVTGDMGEIWLIIGIDSGYPAAATYFLNSVMVRLY